MSSIFPLRQHVELDEDRGPRLVELDEDVADEVFAALSSGTTRRIFSSLHEHPQTASDLAELTDTSVQNVQYHLEKLVEADLVEAVDTWYSERGTEMKVYAPTDESLVVFAGQDKQRSLRALLKRLVGLLAVLAPASAVVGWLASRVLDGSETPSDAYGSGGSDGADGSDGIGIASEGPTPTPELDTAVDTVAGADPALVAGGAFLLGGLFVLAVMLAIWYWKK